MKLTLNQFKKIVIFFSLVLLLDYPILPWILSFSQAESQCEYDGIICVSLSSIFILIIAFIWYVIIKANYFIFFTDRYKSKYNFDSSEKASSILFFLKSLFIKKYYFNSWVGKSLILSTMLLFCLGALWILISLVIKLNIQ